jgi:hypothetical protein
MVADLDTIEPNCCPKLCFVNSENGHTTRGGDVERAAVPKPVADLSRFARIIDDGALGKFSPTDSVLNRHPAIELVYLREGGLGRVREARYRNLAAPDDRDRFGISSILDIPCPVQ